MRVGNVLTSPAIQQPTNFHMAPMGGVMAATLPVTWLASQAFGLTLRIDSLPQAAWVLALAPLLEEAAFRPLLQRGLHETLEAWTKQAGHLANLLTALAFAASHLPAQGVMALLWLVPAAAVGEIWRRSGRLWQCVLLHAWCNACLAFLSP
ncbi:MAG: CPBP family intramembrane metalloprotease [Betaproteobacteria bacterium]|nr:CPBP family intramembrane metalloprotease [Betaproteobacteria bacterium]MBK7654762.1 CPBP family intramembrane metalloprotease [Betaproteobacteria bacterium]